MEMDSGQRDLSVASQASPPGQPSARWASSLTLVAVLSQLTTLGLVAATWHQTLSAWLQSGQWAPHAVNAGIALALSFPSALILALRLGAIVLERRK